VRILFTCQAALPHLFPMVPLAWALRAAGHEVRIASGTPVVDQIVHTGLPAVSLDYGREWTEAEIRERVADIWGQDAWPPNWAENLAQLSHEQHAYLRKLGGNLVHTAETVVDELIEFAETWRPDLVVYDAISYGGAVVSGLLGVPGVKHMFGTATVPRLELTPDGTPLPEYVRLFESRGVPADYAPAVLVDPTPPSLRIVTEVDRINMRHVPYNGPGVVPDWVALPAPRPRVCFTWGHTGPRSLGSDAVAPYRAAIEAIAELDVEIVVASTATQLDLLGELPAVTHRVASLPLNLILPHCDVLVHQGGDGTVLAAAAAGVPQLVISRKPDAETPASRIAVSGAGLWLRYQELRTDPNSSAIIRDAVRTLLTDHEYRTAADRLRAEIEHQPPPAEIVPRLEQLASA
jgi:glycosyltransferase